MNTILNTFKENGYREKLISPMDNTDPIYDDFKKRVYPDISTDAFTKTFLESNEMLYTFVDFVASFINVTVNYDVNRALYDKGLPVLNNEELIVLIFKGGNVLKSLYEESIKTTDTYVLNKVVDIQGEKKRLSEVYEKYIAPNFKTSDVDYSLYIVTKDNHRYTQMYTLAYNSLINCIENISSFFESYLDAVMKNANIENKHNNPKFFGNRTMEEKMLQGLKSYNQILDEIIKVFLNKDPILSMDRNSLNTLLNNCPNLTTKVSNIIKNYRTNNNFDSVKFFVETSLEWLDYIRSYFKNLDDILELENIMHTLYKILYITKIFQKVEKSNNVKLPALDLGDINGLIKDVAEHMFTIIQYKRSLLIEYQFYTKEKIQTYLKKVSELMFNNEVIRDSCMLHKVSGSPVSFYKYNHNHHQYTENGNEYLTYFGIRPRKSVKLTTTTNPFNLSSIKEAYPERVHYITFNNVINVYKGCTNWITFDLLRIKFNGFIKKNNNDRFNIMYINGAASEMNIPSEFIDISIVPFTENYKNLHIFELKNHVNYIVKDVRKHIIKIISYSVNDLKLDLENMLFKQNIFPWEDTKYEKRLKRLIYTIYFTNMYHNKPRIAEKLISTLNVIAGNAVKYMEVNKELPIDYIINHKLLETGKSDNINPDNLVQYQIDNIETYVSRNIIVSKSDDFVGAAKILEKMIVLSHINHYDTDRYFEFLKKYYSVHDPSRTVNEAQKEQIVKYYKKNTLEFFKIIEETTAIILELIINSKARAPILSSNVDNSFSLVGGLNRTKSTNTEDYQAKYAKYKKKYINQKRKYQ
jgi:hypothetical protein